MLAGVVWTNPPGDLSRNTAVLFSKAPSDSSFFSRNVTTQHGLFYHLLGLVLDLDLDPVGKRLILFQSYSGPVPSLFRLRTFLSYKVQQVLKLSSRHRH